MRCSRWIDSTAVGMTSEVPLMVAAILSSAVVMVLCAEKINDYVSRYPGFKTLTLLFLVMLGAMLMAEGFEIHFNKGLCILPWRLVY